MRLPLLLGAWVVFHSTVSVLVATPADTIRVRFVVTAPRHFAGDDELYVAGAHPSLGSWEPGVAVLAKSGGRFTGVFTLPAKTAVEYKITRGRWESAETTAKGGERPNRTVYCESDCVIAVDVENFRLPYFHAVPDKASPHVFYHHELYAKDFDNYRSLAVYLPPQYFSEPARRFPVLYSLDGNNLFDPATMGSRASRRDEKRWEEWRLDETLDDAFANGRLEPFIVVGVYNTKRRADEYVPCRTGKGGGGGMAAEYLEFLVGTVKPFVDGRYRTRPERESTALLGASFGGTFTLFASKTRPEIFSRFIAMSSAYWPGGKCLFDWLRRPVSPLPDRLWLDMGDREEVDLAHFSGAVADLHESHELLKASGVPADRIRALVVKDGHHNESDWGKRIETALRFAWSR